VWHQNGVQIGVAVNFNVGLLADLEVPDRLELLMREYDLDPRYLTLEFTEIAPLEEPRMMIDIMTRLRLKGFRLSLDDFGTGYSSFTQLTRMPFNEVKLDRSLMEDVPGRPESETILRALVQLGQTLGITVCAEGIDREDLLHFLKELGCNRLQGHLISRALSSAEMQEFYHRWNGESLAA
jgi:EAL domain-containing protein (putative c-di-GMP-specific phosphodiesterase class I)